jgi:pimeloyl-ACP methyl ester carboxylesterase
MARFVLVHGAWHGGWCFGELASELERRGHEAWAPDLPCDDASQDQNDYAALLGDCSDAVVVGHSLGGLTIALVEAAVHVYLAALLPVEKVLAGAFADGFGGFVRDDQNRSYWPDADTTAERMYPDCTRARSDWAYSQLRPQSRIEPIVRAFEPGDVMIATTRDAAIDPAWQVRTAHAYGLRVIELEAGHSPFFTQPAELADALSSVV